MYMIQFFQQFAANACAGKAIFGIPPWYQYMVAAGRIKLNAATRACELDGAFKTSDLTLITLGILDILIRLAGLIAVGYIIYGGIQYVTSQGEPDKAKQAQTTIANALIGLVVAITAAATVGFIGRAVG